VRELEPAALDELLGGGRGELARLVPKLGAAGSPMPREWTTDEPVARARLFEALLGVVKRLGEEAPVLLEIDDIHWADRSTLDILALLIANTRRERLMLMCSYRTDQVHRGHTLRSFLAQHETRAGMERLELRAFTREELRIQLHGILGGSADPALVHRLDARSEGNAVFTEELIAASPNDDDLPRKRARRTAFSAWRCSRNRVDDANGHAPMWSRSTCRPLTARSSAATVAKRSG
jgi:hypothetical protein